MSTSPIEVRILGCLVEKERTTPEAYPLSTNALLLACNQKSNREPVTNYHLQEVEDTLRLLRIQDHLRRLGLATEFMRLLLNRQLIEAVDIRGGWYGLGGVCRNRIARQVQQWMEDALALARRRKRARRDAVRARREARLGRLAPPTDAG